MRTYLEQIDLRALTGAPVEAYGMGMNNANKIPARYTVSIRVLGKWATLPGTISAVEADALRLKSGADPDVRIERAPSLTERYYAGRAYR